MDREHRGLPPNWPGHSRYGPCHSIKAPRSSSSYRQDQQLKSPKQSAEDHVSRYRLSELPKKANTIPPRNSNYAR